MNTTHIQSPASVHSLPPIIGKSFIVFDHSGEIALQCVIGQVVSLPDIVFDYFQRDVQETSSSTSHNGFNSSTTSFNQCKKRANCL